MPRYVFIMELKNPLTREELIKLEMDLCAQVMDDHPSDALQLVESPAKVVLPTPEDGDAGWEQCTHCGGADSEKCGACRGLGLQQIVETEPEEIECKACRGLGYHPDDRYRRKCLDCTGTGKR